MTLLQWILTALLLVGVYLSGYYVPDDPYLWFALACSISFIAILLILQISISIPSIILAILELSGMIVIALSWAFYADEITNPFWYDKHESIIEGIVIAQAIILLWIPVYGELNRIFKQLGLVHILQSAINHRRKIHRE
ncbi:MAG: hypothetical protein O7D95_06155 [Betaproteobacteria bacterium]|nr:hypothetical protein [Betaproteobacteria bacterium]